MYTKRFFIFITLLGMALFCPTSQSQAVQEKIDQFSCTNVTEIPQIECETFVALYNGENGP